MKPQPSTRNTATDKELSVRANKLQESRKRLLDLTHRNRLLNFRPGDPNHKEDTKTHKHMVFKAELEALWSLLVEDEAEACLNFLPPERLQQIMQERARLGTRRLPAPVPDERAVALSIPPEEWKRVAPTIRNVSDTLRRGDLISLLSEEAFKKRAARIRNEQNSLIDSTGDSALFLALGFLQWAEDPPHAKAGQPVFAPLVLLHVELQELRQDGGGERSYLLRMDGDQPQDNPCLAAKLREFNIDLPPLEEDEGIHAYLKRVRRAIQHKQGWAVSEGVALGFFNFARYRLWLDLNPDEWPEGTAPASHPIVGSILDGKHLAQGRAIPDDKEVARTQSEDDLLTVLDADSTQYAALLAAQRGTSMVVIGPPGSGKSQTITNLIAVALAKGKRVLFVAQKKTALQVVERNLKKSELDKFCLPFFGEQSRATEVLNHLGARESLQGATRAFKPPANGAAPVAQKLNQHADRLARIPPGYRISVSEMLRNASAQHLQVRDLWGTAWSEDLLVIPTPKGEPPDAWLSEREQCLAEWQRLKGEAGNWCDWSPVKLGPFDVGGVEAAAQRYLAALVALTTHGQNWPDTVLWSLRKWATVADQITAAQLREMKVPVPRLVAFLCEATANHAKAARLEQDLEELARQRQQAERVLRVSPDTAATVLPPLASASTLLGGMFNNQCTLFHAREVLASMAGVLQATEDLLAESSAYPDGISCLISDPAAKEFQWRHLKLLEQFQPEQMTQIAGVKLPLARHVREDSSRLEQARTLAVELGVARQVEAEIRSDVGCVEGWLSPGAIHTLRLQLEVCVESGLGAVKVGDVPALLPLLPELVAEVNPRMKTIAERTQVSSTVGYYVQLMRMHRLSESLFRGPVAMDWTLLARADPAHLQAANLVEFAAAVEAVQGDYRRLQASFGSGLRLEAASLRGTAAALANAYALLSELGLVDCTLGAVSATAESARKLEPQFREAIALCAQTFGRWQLRAPESKQEVQAACQLLRRITSRPPAPTAEAASALTSQHRCAALRGLQQERQALAEFAKQHNERIAFRDLPTVEIVVQMRRELRSFGTSPLRVFSSKYRRLRKQAGVFLNAPLPSDAEVIRLLDQVEEHLQRTSKLQQHPDHSLLGTDEKRLEEYLCWQAEVFTLAGEDDVSLLLRADQDSSALKLLLQKLESLLEGLESYLVNCPGLTEEGCRWLSEINAKLASAVQQFGAVLPSQHAQPATQLLAWAEALSACADRVDSLDGYADLIAERPVDTLNGKEITATAGWLKDLAEQQVLPEIVLALSRRSLDGDQILSVSASANRFQATLLELQRVAGGRLPCVSEASPLDGLSERLSILHAALQAAQAAAGTYQLRPTLTLSRCHELTGYSLTLLQIRTSFAEWESVLGDRPAGLSEADVTDTLTWLAALRAAGARGTFLNWLLADETAGRIAWWKNIVARTRTLLARLNDVQKELLPPLHQPGEAVEAWLARLADENANLSAALETSAVLCHQPATSLQEFGVAVSSLARSLEIAERLKPWRELLGQPEEIAPGTVAEHRLWVAGTQMMPPLFGSWLQAGDYNLRTSEVNQLAVLVREIEQEQAQFKEALQSYGAISLTRHARIPPWFKASPQDQGALSGLAPFATLDRETDLGEMAIRVKRFLAALPSLPSFAAMVREHERAAGFGLSRLLEQADTHKPTPTTLVDTFRAAVAWQQAMSVWQADDGLRQFSSGSHERLRQTFQQADERLMQANQRRIAAQLAVRCITEGDSGKSPKDLSERQLLRHEQTKRRKHLPIRKLVQRAGRAMQDLCPCWMMTPLAVAQFLPAGQINFDLVIMDEASQLNPEDAWGAIARGSQLVVVGDPKQMPPSDFFSSTLEEDESSDSDDDINGAKAESILDAATIALPLAWLEWHYRSRHESLIAPANLFSYGNKLILFPSPHRNNAEQGIGYHFVPKAVVTTGKVTNPVEAAAVVSKLRTVALEQARKPVGQRRSIGVVAMNLPQAECIQDLLAQQRSNDPELDQACAKLEADESEPLFIKNLENIQGDERDVMLISCTYGPQTQDGTPTQRFGPLSMEGGERRFNVLITRAKWRMEVFASLLSAQILTDGKKQGVVDFHYFLKFAETGQLVEAGKATRKTHDSPFEAQVDAVLRQAGYQVEPQVGVAGYFIDLAVRHPADSGRFVIGIECDGATYHSSRAARDRDRLRERVLKERGWNLHRIWSTDWFTNQNHARERLLLKIAEACRQ